LAHDLTVAARGSHPMAAALSPVNAHLPESAAAAHKKR
jgi:hypothetical protein